MEGGIPELNIKERKTLNSIIKGTTDINSSKAQQFLSRPEVAITFEALLNNQGLTDEKIATRVLEIFNRTPTRNITILKDGRKKTDTNITSIDSNVINAARLIWQAKGKMIEKQETKLGVIASIPDEQLDKYIEQSMIALKHGGRAVLSGN